MTASRPDPLLAIDANGSLRVDAPTGRSIRIRAEGKTLAVDAPGWEELTLLGPASLLARRRAVARMARVLTELGLRANIAVAQRNTLQLGAGTRPTLLARLLGLGCVHLPLTSVIELWRSSERRSAHHR